MSKDKRKKRNIDKSDMDVNESADSVGQSIEQSVKLSAKEIRRRKRKVRHTKTLFRAIDILFNMAQNTCPYVDKNNVNTIECINDIVYDEALPNVCKLDFYRVNNTGEKQPAVILIHGGGFIAGDKKYRKGRSQYFALNGFSVFCINYGLAPDFIFPDPLKHIVTAANFIYDNAEKYNIDADRIFVGGDSAGGYYAAMLAAFNGSNKLKDAFGFAPKFKIFGALLNCGVYDMQTVLNANYPFDLADGVILSLTGIRGEDFDNYEHKDVCIPIDFVTADYPPVFLIYSDSDVFCKGQGNLMVDKLKSCGVYCEYYAARHITSNHCFSLTWSSDDAVAANELMMSFAKRRAADNIKI